MKVADPLLSYLESRLGRADGRGVERHFACPFCLDRKGSESPHKKLDINLENGAIGCYRCAWRGNLMKLFRDLNPRGRLTMQEIQLLRREKRMEPSVSPSTAVRRLLSGTKEVAGPDKRAVALPSEYIPITPNVGRPTVAPAVRYLKQRGAPPEMWEKFQIGYATEGRYAGYLIFPITQGGEVRYFTTRYAGDGRVKTLNPKADEEGKYVTKDDVLLGFDLCMGAKVVGLTEGPFSCMAYHMAQTPAVAGLGKEYTDRQVELVRTLVHYGTEEFVVAFDDDAVGKAQQMVGRLTGHVPKVTIAVLASGDPWDNRERIPEILANRAANARFSSLVRSRLRLG